MSTADSGGRIGAAVELLLGAAVVLAHNVWHVLPNEVPILVVAALLWIWPVESAESTCDAGVDPPL